MDWPAAQHDHHAPTRISTSLPLAFARCSVSVHSLCQWCDFNANRVDVNDLCFVANSGFSLWSGIRHRLAWQQEASPLHEGICPAVFALWAQSLLCSVWFAHHYTHRKWFSICLCPSAGLPFAACLFWQACLPLLYSQYALHLCTKPAEPLPLESRRGFVTVPGICFYLSILPSAGPSLWD